MRAAGLSLTVGELLAALDGVDERLPVRTGDEGSSTDVVQAVEVQASQVLLIAPSSSRPGWGEW